MNDTFGHLVGDEVLKLISRTVNSNVRDEDIFGRYGGEEFIVIVKCLNEKELEHVANKLRILIQKSSLIIDDALIETTVSMGGAMFHSGESIEAFINKADKAMYHSKQTGKNKVTIY